MPKEIINAFKFCYVQSRCAISVKGNMFPGFSLAAGVRQGCPLSPIAYALVADVLLDKLEDAIEDILVRAYADDNALIVKMRNVTFQNFGAFSRSLRKTWG